MLRIVNALTSPAESRRLLAKVLVATALAPIPAAALGYSFALPLGITMRELAVSAGLLTVAILLRRGRRLGWAGTRAALGTVAQVAALATALGFFMERNSNGFYTPEALLEGSLVLLALHVTTAVLRRGVPGRATAAEERATRTVAARSGLIGLPDDLTITTLYLVIAFWVVSLFGSLFAMHEAALVLLLGAGVACAFEVLLLLAVVALRGSAGRPSQPR